MLVCPWSASRAIVRPWSKKIINRARWVAKSTLFWIVCFCSILIFWIVGQHLTRQFEPKFLKGLPILLLDEPLRIKPPLATFIYISYAATTAIERRAVRAHASISTWCTECWHFLPYGRHCQHHNNAQGRLTWPRFVQSHKVSCSVPYLTP